MVRGVIGQGGMGLVLRVESLADGACYALKYCRLEGLERKRFTREVRLMQRVRHPNVVRVLHSNLRHDPPYFVMPLAEHSLESELPRIRGDEAQALSVFRQVGLGVRALHDCGIVHRDLKPANILRFADGRIAVSDLGLAKCESGETTELTQTRAILGTFAFLAPEQLLPEGSRRADVRTDIFQLGKVLYQILTGLSPALIDPKALPRGLAHILQRATCQNPDGRYRRLGEFFDALRYYELAKDPVQHSREALESLVLQAEDLLKRREDLGGVVPEILAVLSQFGHPDPAPTAVLSMFDRIPDPLLRVMAREFGDEFLPVLRGYAEAIRVRAARCNFAYADLVARRMRAVFAHACHVEVKRVALQALLVAAVALNRFAAMGVFNRLLIDIKTADLAIAVAEMLRDHADYYRQVGGVVPSNRLHPVIGDVQRDLLFSGEVPF
jgi:serine/threonine protein kinase